MTEVQEKKEEKKSGNEKDSSRAPAKAPSASAASRGGSSAQGRQKNKPPRRPRDRKRFEKPEFEQKIIDIRRVTRVVAGGRRFSFSVSLVAGDRNGRVGVGLGKASDTALAIEKAFRNAKRNMITVKRTKSFSIPHEEEVKYSTARIVLMPAPGRGIVAGSAVRTVLDLAGVEDVGAKVLSRSKNKLNIARAAVKALAALSERKPVRVRAAKREAEKTPAKSNDK